MERNKMLLVGGNGFVGMNLQDEFKRREIDFISIDKEDEDLTKCNGLMIKKLKDTTHVFLLASKVGAKLFNETPIEPYEDNLKILQNCISAIRTASSKYNRKYNVIWFSSSEIYGDIGKNRKITDKSNIIIDNDNCRSLYSIVKIIGELLLKDMFKKEEIQSLSIFRLFNISGRHQKRGVLYDMVKSSLTKNKIYYSKDTTRTITSVDYMLNEIMKYMDNTDSIIEVNVSESRNSMYMKDLASLVAKYFIDHELTDGILLIPTQKDCYLRFRHTSIPNNVNVNIRSINNSIGELINEIRYGI